MAGRRFGPSRRPGGDQLVQQAEAKPDRRESLAGPVLAELGAWDLDPRTDADELEAAAALCRSAGYWALPYPVAERLAQPIDLDVDGLIVVADTRPSGAVAGLEMRWAAVTLDGLRSNVAGHGRDRPGVRRRARTVRDRRERCGRRRARARCCPAGRCSACSTAHWS